MSRRTQVTFTIYGTTAAELGERAEAEIKRFYGLTELPATFGYQIDASDFGDGKHGYWGTVLAWR